MSRFTFFLLITLLSFQSIATVYGQKNYSSANATVATTADNNVAFDVQSPQYVKLTSSAALPAGTITLPNGTLNYNNVAVWASGNAFAMVLDASSLISKGITDANGRTIYQVPNIPFLGFTLGTTLGNNPTRWLSPSLLTGTKFCVAVGSSSTNPVDTNNIPCYFSTITGSAVTLQMTNDLYFFPGSFTQQSNVDFTTAKTYTASIPINVTAGAASYTGFPSYAYYTGGYEALFTTTLNFTVNIKPKFCELDTSDMNQTIDMGIISTTSLDNGDLQRGPAISFNFTCPSYANVDIHMEVSDVNNSSNTTNTLTLASIDNSASGVGIKLKDQAASSYINFSNGVAASSQPIVKSVSSLGTTGSQRATYTLVPYYTKTGTVTAGKVQAQAKVIFNYE